MPNGYLYTSREYGRMLMCLGEAQGNAAHALRLYRERFPAARHPADARVITAAYQRVLENRHIAPVATGGGRDLDPRIEDRILDVVHGNPRLGTRSMARLLRRPGGAGNVSHTSVHRVLRRHIMRPYKVHKVQALIPGDQDRRLAYCRWLLEQNQNVPGFIENVIWSDESTFTRNGMWNRRNTHVWSARNPYAYQQIGHQTRWSVNVWAGIHNRRIIGPIFLPQRINGPRYFWQNIWTIYHWLSIAARGSSTTVHHRM